jgi:2'-5' RNA ligase
LRLFVAVDISDEARARLTQAAGELRERVAAGRWVPPENWHVTMKFLGSTWPRLVEWVETTCAEVAAANESLETSLEGLGAFPHGRRARVLWAGLGDAEERLARIASALDAALVDEFKPEKRAFRPHLTIARFGPPTSLGEALSELEVSSEPFRIDRLVLYRSHLQRPVPRYESLREFPLGTTFTSRS